MNRTSLVRACAIAAALAIALAFRTSGLAGTTATVTIDNDAFNPTTITIAAGQTVTFTNRDDEAHTVTADDRSYDSKPMRGTFRHRFTKRGRYAYHCEIHPFMHGVVIVK
jgi:plastocyanin